MAVGDCIRTFTRDLKQRAAGTINEIENRRMRDLKAIVAQKSKELEHSETIQRTTASAAMTHGQIADMLDSVENSEATIPTSGGVSPTVVRPGLQSAIGEMAGVQAVAEWSACACAPLSQRL